RVVAVEAEQVSGTKLRRVGFDRILDLAEDRLIDVVVVAKVDRFATGRLVDAMLESALKELGVELLYVGRDTATPEGRLLVNIEKDFAEWERERILERLNGGKFRAARKGKVICTWMAPYGYRVVHGEGRLEIYEPEAQVVR